MALHVAHKRRLAIGLVATVTVAVALSCNVMDSVTRALGDPRGAVITSIFCPNEIFHALGVHPATAEAVASFASGAQAESGFISFAESRGVPETYCSFHRILMTSEPP